MTTEFDNETNENRYSLRVNGELVAVLDYRILSASVSFTRAFTVPPQRGNGYAARLVEFAVDDIEATTSLRIVPMCWYVAQWFDEHPERAGLLERGAG